MSSRKVALVTGSTSGIGLGIARLLAARGYLVVVHSRSSAETGRDLAAELDGIYVQADLGEDEDRCRLAREASGITGQLDVLVNNAGISQVIPHADLRAATPKIWHDLYEVNVIAPFRLVAEAEPYLRKAAQGGSSAAVVNIGSHAGARPKGASIPYSASKAALAHVTRLLAVSLAPEVRVNAVAPGLVDTPLTATWEDAQALWRERAPMRRAATPEDIAQCVLALIEARYLTGEVILADGGLNLT
jgi:NAD(P)-dependent dehydrogenase (short-subunit alcohol dehydrogenase family)